MDFGEDPDLSNCLKIRFWYIICASPFVKRLLIEDLTMADLTPAASAIRGGSRVETWSFALSVIAFAMLVLIGLIAGWTLREVKTSDFWVDHTYAVLESSQQLLADVKDAELASRAYLLVPEDRFQTDFQQSIHRIPDNFSSLRKLTADNTIQQHRLDELDPLLTKRIENLSQIMRLREDKGLDAALSLRRDGSRRVVAERVRELCRQVKDEEYGLLQTRVVERRNRLKQGLAGTLGAASLAFAALVLAPFEVRRAVKQRNSAQRDKQESDSLVHSLFEAAPQAILIVDRDGLIVMANPAAERIFGYDPRELRGLTLETLLPVKLRTEHIAHRESFFADPQTRPMGIGLDLQAQRKDASELPVEVSLSSIHTTRGVLAVAFASDISKRRADEVEIREQREMLRMLAGRLQTAREDESRRIARNLHDDLSQKLARVAMDLGKLATKSGLDGVSQQLRMLQGRAAEAADLVRKISHEIHPAILDDLGLKAALEEFCLDFQQRSGIETEFEAHNLPDYLPADVSSCAYYATGECLRNVAKHSHAKSVFVDIEMDADKIHVCVKDDGVGFNPMPSKVRAGIGVAAMKERIHLAGGSTTIHSSPGNGTQVDFVIPVVENQATST